MMDVSLLAKTCLPANFEETSGQIDKKHVTTDRLKIANVANNVKYFNWGHILGLPAPESALGVI